MPMDSGEDTKKTPAASSESVSLPPNIDDEMLAGRAIEELMRYTICAVVITDINQKNIKPRELLDYEEQTGNILPDKYTTVDHGRRYICGVYYAASDAAGKGLAVQGALRDFGEVQSVHIREAVPVKSNRNDFNIKDKKPEKTFSFEREGIYKKILTDKDKIRSLYNYADLPLASDIHNLMQKRSGNGLPVRLTFYEDPSALGVKALAVAVFSEKEKYLIALKDFEGIAPDIYGIKPDASYIYR